MIENVPKVAEAYEKGRLAFGTIDAWVVYRLNGGAKANVFVTDPSNASRSMFMNIHTLKYDEQRTGTERDVFYCTTSVTNQLSQLTASSQLSRTISTANPSTPSKVASQLPAPQSSSCKTTSGSSARRVRSAFLLRQSRITAELPSSPRSVGSLLHTGTTMRVERSVSPFDPLIPHLELTVRSWYHSLHPKRACRTCYP